MKLAGFLAAGLGLLFAPANAAVIFSDGFESPEVEAWDLFETAGPWIAVEDFVEIQNESIGLATPHSGSQYAELAGNSNSLIAALVDFEPGQTYHLSFYYQPRTDVADDNALAVMAGSLIDGSFDGSVLAVVSEVASDVTDWFLISLSFVASDTMNAIAFQGLGGPENGRGAFIDDVSISAPVPAGIWLFLSALGLGGLLNRKRRGSVRIFV